MALFGLGSPPDDRCVVDDCALDTGVDHVAHDGSGAAHGAIEGDGEHRRPLLVGHVDELDLSAEPGIVHHHVDAAHGSTAAARALHIILDRDVADRRVRSDAGGLGETVGGLAESAFVDVGDQDLRTSSRQRSATAEPIPVPAAAVTTTRLPASSSRPGGGVGITRPSRRPSPPCDVRDQR